MENTMNSERKTVSNSERTSDHESQEESGWTLYFEDFFNNSNNNGESSLSFEGHDYCTKTSSLVSDAASSVAKRFAPNDQQDVVGMPIMEKRSYNRSLGFKKRKLKGGLVDDALEDTASSPANSPKVYSTMNKLENPKEKDHSLNIYINDQEKGSNSRNSDVSCTEMKKMGLCLVPLSMLGLQSGDSLTI